jgi:DNA-binding response OmpR family regulator
MRTSSGIVSRPLRRSVLFVDRDPDLSALYMELAEALGARAIHAARWEHGLAKARLQQPDAIVLDTGHTPDVSIMLARVWRAVAPHASLVAVTTDARTASEVVQRFGFDAVLIKPFDLAQFEAVLADAMARANGRRAMAT